MATIDMQTMRYLNLLDRVTHVKTSKCFTYGGTVYFAVPSFLMNKILGEGALPLKRLQDQIGKRVKVVAEPSGQQDAVRFVRDVVAPVQFKDARIEQGTLVIVAGGMQQKASLFGRNKTRFAELAHIVDDLLHLDLKIM